MKWWLPLLVLLALTACTGSRTAATDDALEGAAWVVESIGDQSPTQTFTMQFSDGTLSGQSACADYEGRYTTRRGERLIIDRVFTDSIACLPPESGAEQAAFGTALQQVAGYTVTDTTLTLTDISGAPVITLSAAP